MKRLFVAFATAALAASLPLSTGCAADEAEAREAAYPQAIGYTPPPSAPPAPGLSVGASPGLSVGAPPPTGFPSAVPPPAPYGAEVDVASSEPGPAQPASGQEVVVGDANDGDVYSDADPSALTDFRGTLEPYGTWTDDATYGTVWAPAPSVVGPNFTPYVTAGHWVYDDDYVWVSDYDWGWAPFHYGRWVYNGIGWVWIPGRTYAGAWVSWRYGYGDWGYVGWAPLAPSWCWHRGVAVGIGFVPRMPYAFVSSHEVFAPAVASRVIAGPQVGVVASHTRPWVAASPHVGSVAGGLRVAVGGPPPSTLNIAAPAVVRTPANNRGLMQAQAFARPSTAVMLGARAPQASMQAGWGTPSQRASSSAVAPMAARQSVPSYAPPAQAQSHFGGRFGTGFSGSTASASPPMQASPPVHSYGESAHPYFGAPRVAAPTSIPGYHSPSVSIAPTYSAPPAFHAAAAPPSSSGTGAGFHSSVPASGGYHVGGGSSHISSGSFSGGGGFGGGHVGGGGGGGGGHSGGGGRGGGRR
ncbi:MAG TPA: DUF6600 domain-containing protein [Polyangiaceae bacterium]|jgi:hypothetical protein|nr:DUF6600 domain-containing protein [Polyangiaceae bacterium]